MKKIKPWMIEVAALAPLLAGVALFYAQMVTNRSPRFPVLTILLLAAAVGLSVWGILRGRRWRDTLASIPVFGLTAVLLVFILGTGLPDQPIAVKVGDPAPDFTAKIVDGQPFRLHLNLGKPILLKFFRGHW